MRRRTVVRPEAQTDVKEAARWYESREAGLGTRYVDQIRNTLQQITENPLRFPVATENVRRAVLQKFPYSVYYIIESDSTAVIAVLHQHVGPDSWQVRRQNDR